MIENDGNIINDVKKSSVLTWIKNLIGKINRKTVIDIIIIIIPIMMIAYFLTGTKTPPEIKELTKNNKVIEKKIDSISSDNQFLFQRMYEMEQKQTIMFDMINQNNDLIRQSNKELLRLNKIYHEKINNVNGYNISQLDSFFSNRYEKYYKR